MPYFQTNFSFVAKTISIAVNFIFLDHSAYWLLDDVILLDVNSSQNVLQNGNFENGNLTNWNCYQSNTNTSKVISNGSFPSKSGNYSFVSGPKPDKDYLTQIIPTEIEKFYHFHFGYLTRVAVRIIQQRSPLFIETNDFSLELY